jgi:MFS family permease
VVQEVRRLGRVHAPFYGWWLVGLSVLVTGLSTGPIWGGVGIWVKSLELQFRWSRTRLTGAFSLAQLEGSIAGPLVGFFTDRVGTRRMVLVGLLVIGAGFILFSYTTNLAVFYLSYAIIMLGGAAGTWLPLMTALNKWFARRRGTAMAIAGEGYFLGGVILAPILAWAVNPDHHGWSITARGIGVLFLVIAWPISRLVRNNPEEYGQSPDGEPVVAQAAPGPRAETPLFQQDFTAREAMRTPAFWLISVGHGLSAMMIATVSVHLVPLLTDQGLSLQMASYVWSVSMAVGAAFSIVGGYLGDRVPKRLALCVFSTIQAAGFAMAMLVDSAAMGFLFAVVFGMGQGGRSPLSTAIRGDYFGRKAFATITGISQAPLYILMLVAPLFAAVMFDMRGSYTLAFGILAAFGFLSGLCFLLARKPAPPPLRTGRAAAAPPTLRRL